MNTRCPFTALCFDAECTIINIKELYWFIEKEKSLLIKTRACSRQRARRAPQAKVILGFPFESHPGARR
jgi:hypothetical protein